MTDPIFAVGDIHGRKDELDRVLALIEADPDVISSSSRAEEELNVCSSSEALCWACATAMP